jgi:hypothetical protein
MLHYAPMLKASGRIFSDDLADRLLSRHRSVPQGGGLSGLLRCRSSHRRHVVTTTRGKGRADRKLDRFSEPPVRNARATSSST